MPVLPNLAPQVDAAFVAAGAALLVALVQFWLSRRQLREVENLKGELARRKDVEAEYLKRYLESVTVGHDALLSGYKAYLSSVQALRDRVARVKSRPESFAADRLAEELNSQAEEVSNAFGALDMHLRDDERRMAHTLKNACFDLVDCSLTFHRMRSAGMAQAGVALRLQQSEQKVRSIHQELRQRAVQAVGSYVESLRYDSATP
jgi:hypothetical protein